MIVRVINLYIYDVPIPTEPTLEQLEALKTCQDGAGLSQTSSQAQAGSLEIVLERKAKNKKYSVYLLKRV